MRMALERRGGFRAEDVAVVTGAGRGIGRAAALRFAAEGAAVAAVARSEPEIAAVAREIEARGGRARFFACDVTREDAVAELPLKVAQALGPASIVVNNAGAAESAPFLKTTYELWQRMMRVNVDSAFLVTRAFLPALLERGRGRVVNVSSIAGKVGAAYIAAYCASKHALVGLTRALSIEVAKKGITVNAVCPGYVDTPLTEGSVENMARKTGRPAAEIRATLEAMSPQGRIYASDEVAEVIVRVASDAWAGVNGQCIVLDGGSVQA
jgi:NAD(P)-dependent dehydrogenase (short-subunit alcohol dehydrogenase family)